MQPSGSLQADAMNLIEKTHSFIVRVWLEEPPGVITPGTWRGHITHIPDGERQHVQDLAGISDFIARYLRQMGADPGSHHGLSDWFKWWKL